MTKVCVMCKHWWFECGYPDLSDMTPGENWSSGCKLKKWNFSADDDVGEETWRDTILMAESCLDFEGVQQKTNPQNKRWFDLFVKNRLRDDIFDMNEIMNLVEDDILLLMKEEKVVEIIEEYNASLNEGSVKITQKQINHAVNGLREYQQEIMEKRKNDT